MILLSKASAKEARKCRVTDRALREAVLRARRGQVDAQLGSTFIKQEVARPPEGRKIACRAIIALRKGAGIAVVMHVYAKSAKSDLSPGEYEVFSDLSEQLVELSEVAIKKLINDRGWKDIENGEERP